MLSGHRNAYPLQDQSTPRSGLPDDAKRAGSLSQVVPYRNGQRNLQSEPEDKGGSHSGSLLGPIPPKRTLGTALSSISNAHALTHCPTRSRRRVANWERPWQSGHIAHIRPERVWSPDSRRRTQRGWPMKRPSWCRTARLPRPPRRPRPPLPSRSPGTHNGARSAGVNSYRRGPTMLGAVGSER